MEKSNVLIEIIEEKVDCEVDIETPVMVSKLVWRSKEETQAARDLLSSITSLISLCESDPTGNGENSSTRASNIVSLVSDYLSMIPTHIVHDAEVHIIDFMFSGTPKALVSLVLNSPTQCYKQAGEESIKLFLYPNIRSIPKSIWKHCVSFANIFIGTINMVISILYTTPAVKLWYLY